MRDFNSRRLHFVYVADKMALGQVFLLILRFFPVIAITPALRSLVLYIKLSLVIPWFRDLATALPAQMDDFNSRRLHFVYVADKMALGQVFLLILRFFPVITITTALRTHYSCISAIEKPLNKTSQMLYLRVQ
jgi:branched-subunit amino acid transport protein